ncbi:uncharacterized protein LOC104910469 [Meleagris gallopavo]|uniref:uncharacterized protein LOC104910469 n=1 Tax=Meleagris gallopavo TaxID=9103 RepID=UPI000549AF96|nr:uncharacterized protein LOC104910469 [Meleagris gallopavo]
MYPMGAVTEIGGATRKGADAAPPIGRWRSNASGSGSARSGRGLGLWGAWPARGYLNLEQRDLFTQSVRRRGVRAFVVCVRCRFFFFNTLFFGARVYAEGARPGWARRLSEPVFYPFSSAPCASTEGFLHVPRPGGCPLPYPSRPGARGASLWMRPRSPRREAAGGKRCLQGFTAARHSAPRLLLPCGRSVAAPDRYRRYGREIPARADGGEGLAGPVLHAHPAAGQPRN